MFFKFYITLIIDFGLSEYYFPTNENNPKVASLYYKAPELFIGIHNYHYSLDVWSTGAIFAVFNRDPQCF